MKTNCHRLLSLSVGLLLTAPFAAGALTAEEILKMQNSLGTIRTAELPGQAAQIVTRAKPDERAETAAIVVRAIAAKRPGAIPSVVASISAAVPTVAPKVAGIAAAEAPKDAATIAQVATEAAPAFAAEIASQAGQPRVGIHSNGNGNGNNGNNGNGNGNGNGNNNGANGNGPNSNPPAHGVISHRPGTIRGNRPALPPGLVRDPKPGRDPDRDNYGKPR